MDTLPKPPWHQLAPEEAASILATTVSGLSEPEARARLARHGKNRFEAIRPTPLLTILARQFSGFLVLLLMGAAAISLWNRDLLDALAILAVLLLNGGLGFVTEWRARRAMEGLLAFDVGRTRVVRGGRAMEIAADELVPGDLIELEAGQTVPADARLFASAGLQVAEAPLTGESAQVPKDDAARLPVDTPLPARVTMLYKGTQVILGRGRAWVVATGMETEVGRVGALAARFGEGRTPLEKRLEALGPPLAALAVAAAALAGVAAWLHGSPLDVVLQTAIALAVAAVPEGLPAVATITLALGVHRMARRHALVRRLPSVETLGSTTVICTDKTGTLTTGVMTATVLEFADQRYPLNSADLGTIESSAADLTSSDDRIRRAFRIAILANRAAASRENDRWIVAGDPTESALLVAAHTVGIDPADIRARWPETGEVPFSSERMLMATFHATGDTTGSAIACVKGAPARVLPLCSCWLSRSGLVPLTEADRTRLLEVNRQLANRGLRVLTLAEGPVPSSDGALAGLTFVAFVALRDPPAPGVAETISRFGAAGIRTVMITGDQQGTAAAIAGDLGILDRGGSVLDGVELDRLTDAELAERVPRVAACSRVSPEGKVRLVSAMQQHGAVVAMLGDGVNDAAALRKADIGVAMGLRGTDLAREAADIILADDRFATVGAAIEEGRVIHENVRKAVLYLLACNLAELAVVLGSAALGWPPPLRPLQILWLNLLTDTIPALALAVEPGEPGLMRRPPVDPKAPLVSRPRILGAVGFAALIAGVTLAAFQYGLTVQKDPAAAMALAFLTLAFAQIFHLGNARHSKHVATRARLLANPAALVAVAVTVLLQLFATTWRPLAGVLGVHTLGQREWWIVLGLGLVPAIVGQIVKWWRGGR